MHDKVTARTGMYAYNQDSIIVKAVEPQNRLNPDKIHTEIKLMFSESSISVVSINTKFPKVPAWETTIQDGRQDGRRTFEKYPITCKCLQVSHILSMLLTITTISKSMGISLVLI
jgi:hypothetical protein